MRIEVFSDFDGTITTRDTLDTLADSRLGRAQREHYDRIIFGHAVPLWQAIDEYLRACRIPFEEAVRLLKERVPIDSGFAPFVRWCEDQAIPVTIVSAGLTELVEAYVESLNVRIVANHVARENGFFGLAPVDPRCATGVDKAAEVEQAIRQGAHAVYVGDGFSDRAAVHPAHLVFAKRGLAEYCQDKGIPYIRFVNFSDVERELRVRVAEQNKS